MKRGVVIAIVAVVALVVVGAILFAVSYNNCQSLVAMDPEYSGLCGDVAARNPFKFIADWIVTG